MTFIEFLNNCKQTDPAFSNWYDEMINMALGYKVGNKEEKEIFEEMHNKYLEFVNVKLFRQPQ